MKLRRPAMIWVLTLLFLWAVGKDVEHLLRHSTVSDYQLLAHVGMGALFPPSVALILVFDCASLWFLVRPRAIGLPVLVLTLGLWFMTNALVGFLGIGNVEVLREAYRHGREARGLPIREEAVQFMFSTPVVCALVAGALAVVLAWAIVVVLNRKYFQAAPNAQAA